MCNKYNTMKNNKKSFSIIFVVVLSVVSSFLYQTFHSQSVHSQITQTPSQDISAMLTSSWNGYKKYYIDNGKVVRPDQGYDVVSEGQGYGMLRSVYMNDQTTFDSIWNWTKQNLSRMNNSDQSNRDNLFAWHYNNAVLDWTGATDADEDIATALLFAGKQWGQNSYTQQANAIIADILSKETAKGSDGRLYITGGTYTRYQGNNVDINLSYLAPAYYKLFAQSSGNTKWNSVVDTSYDLLNKSTTGILATNAGLFPNWGILDLTSLTLNQPNGNDRTNAYTYDAFRTTFRVAEDYLWFNEPRASAILGGAIHTFMLDQWNSLGKIYAEYNHDGTVKNSYESSAIYGGDLAVFMKSDPAIVSGIEQKIEKDYIYNNGYAYFASNSTNYYGNNWAAFGLMMGNGNITNLYSSNQPLLPTSSPVTPTTLAQTASKGVSANISLAYTINLHLDTLEVTDATYLVDTEMKNNTGQKVAQIITDNQNQKGTDITIPVKWNVPSGFAKGVYSIEVGIFSPDWSHEYSWATHVGTITIN